MAQIFNSQTLGYRTEPIYFDKEFHYPNGDPIIISSQLNAPYALVSVSDYEFGKVGRVIDRYWLDLYSNPLSLRFKEVVPVALPYDFSNLPALSSSSIVVGGITYNMDDCVFKTLDGHFVYIAYVNSLYVWENYIFNLRFSLITENLISKNNVFDIVIVDGTETTDYISNSLNNLYALALLNGDAPWPRDNAGQLIDPIMWTNDLDRYTVLDTYYPEYTQILKDNIRNIYGGVDVINSVEQESIAILNIPLFNIGTVLVLQGQTKLTLDSVIRGGL